MPLKLIKKLLALIALAPVVLIVMSSCQTQPGTAAYVGDNRITTDRLNELVDVAAQDPYWGEAVKAERGLALRHTLNMLILNDLLKRGARDLRVTIPRSLIADKRENMVDAPSQRAPLLQGVPVDLAAQTDAYIDAVGKVVVGDATASPDIDAQWNDYLAKLIDDYPVRVNPRYGVLEPGTLVLITTREPAVREL